MQCEEKTFLLTAYELATQAYAEAVANLSRAVGAVLYSEYELLQRKASVAREVANEARMRLEERKRQHNC